MLLGLLAAGTALRLVALGGDGYPSDPQEIARWAEGMAAFGPSAFYERVRVGFYPALLYVLWPLGALLDGSALYLAVKGLSIPFDLAIGVLLHRVVRSRASSREGLVAAGLYLLNPAAIVGGALWGQVDAAGALAYLGALVAAAARRWALASALAVVAGLLKGTFGLVAIVVAAAVLIEAVREQRWRPLAAAALGGLAAYLLIAVPLRLGPLDYLALAQEGSDRWPFASFYGLNPWIILVGNLRPDDGLRALSVGLFLVGLVASLAPLARRRDLETLLLVGAFVIFAFYFLPTRVHERYLFAVVALLAPLAALRRGLRTPYLSLSAFFTLGLIFTLYDTGKIALPFGLGGALFSPVGAAALACGLMASAGAIVWRTQGWPVPAWRGPDPRAALALWRGAGAPPAAEAEVATPRLPLLGRVRASALALASLVLVPTIFYAVVLLPELTTRVPHLNDLALHQLFVQRASEALAAGENVFDHWVAEMELGFPEFFYYQHLPYLAVVALHRLLLGLFDPVTLFDAVRYALLVGLPLTVFWSMRRMGFPLPAAAIGAAAAPLLSANQRFGFEYESYLWRGWGLYTQLVAMHLSFVALACVYRVVHEGRGHLGAVLALAALGLSHLLYAYMMAITALVVLAFGATRANLRGRFLRLAAVAAVAFLISSYMFVPFVLEQEYLQVSVLLPRWRWDSFGAGPILGWLVSGSLLDHGRLPFLTALLAVGAAVAAATRQRLGLLALSLLLVWLVLYFGRTTLGPLADLLPFSNGLPAHRFIGGVHLAAVLLIGVGGAAVWRALAAERSLARLALATAALLLLLAPALAERQGLLRFNSQWIFETRAALDRDADARIVLDRLATLPPGRAYAGLRANWGESLNFGLSFNGVHLYNLLTERRIWPVAPPVYSWSLNSDLVFDFDDRRADHYELFNARYVIAPSGLDVPAFLRPILATPRYVLYEAPTSGYAAFVALAERRGVATQDELFTRNRAWILGQGPAQREHIRYDYPSRSQTLGPGSPGCPGGRVTETHVGPARLDAQVDCETAATLVLKTTYHPNWRVTIDGRPEPAFMVSPSYLAVSVPPGRHLVSARYEAAPLKTPLLIAGAAALLGTLVFRRRLERLVAARSPRTRPSGPASTPAPSLQRRAARTLG